MAAPIPVKPSGILLEIFLLVVKKCSILYLGVVTPSSGLQSPIDPTPIHLSRGQLGSRMTAARLSVEDCFLLAIHCMSGEQPLRSGANVIKLSTVVNYKFL